MNSQRHRANDKMQARQIKSMEEKPSKSSDKLRFIPVLSLSIIIKTFTAKIWEKALLRAVTKMPNIFICLEADVFGCPH